MTASTATLCTVLPPADPETNAIGRPYWILASASYHDWADSVDLPAMLAAFKAGGLEFTMQFHPAPTVRPPDDDCRDRLTPADRNPLLAYGW
jgi:hypothetical protein